MKYPTIVMQNVNNEFVEYISYTRRLYRTNKNSNGLSTNIPFRIVRRLGLKAKQKIFVSITTVNDENVIIIKIPRTGELTAQQPLLESVPQQPELIPLLPEDIPLESVSQVFSEPDILEMPKQEPK